jgi:hypothetical protein
MRSILIHLEGGDEGFLRDFDLAELPHLLLAFLLLVEKLLPPGQRAGNHRLLSKIEIMLTDESGYDG